MSVPQVLPPPTQSFLQLDEVTSRGLKETDASFFKETNTLVGSCVSVAILKPEVALSYVKSLNTELRAAVQTVTECREKNQQCFHEMCLELKLSISDIYMKLQKVLGGIFQDNVVNWGRITTLLAYGSYLALFCVQNKLAEVVESLTPWIIDFISTRLKDWIRTNGGWVNFYDQSKRLSNKQQVSEHVQNNSGGWLIAIASGISMGVQIYNRLNGR